MLLNSIMSEYLSAIIENKLMILWAFFLPTIFYPQSEQDSGALAPFSAPKQDKPFISLSTDNLDLKSEWGYPPPISRGKVNWYQSAVLLSHRLGI